MTRHRPIGVFDSGLGGLTVMRALIDLLPDEDLVYFGDTGRFPYGPKPHDDVLKYSLDIADVLLARDVKMIVVACNSAAAAALEALQDRLDDPRDRRDRARDAGGDGRHVGRPHRRDRHRRHDRVGRLPAVRAGVLARERRPITLTCAACPGFVEFVEAGDVDSDQVHVLAERLLAPVREANVDTLVLGCTHYPLLARTIGDVMGQDVMLVSSADDTAVAVRDLLAAGGVQAEPGARDTRHLFLTSGRVDTFRSLGSRFLGPEVDTVEAWNWT